MTRTSAAALRILRVGTLLAAAALLGACAALMMGGNGGYQVPSETCTADRQRAGLCKAP